jgi:hypothetical protein
MSSQLQLRQNSAKALSGFRTRASIGLDGILVSMSLRPPPSQGARSTLSG